MARTKNGTGQRSAASAAHAAPPASPQPGTGPAASATLEAVRAALAAAPADGITAAGIAAAAGVSRTAAGKALTALETDSAARRSKGTRRGVSDTWHPAPPAGSDPATGPSSDPGEHPGLATPAAAPSAQALPAPADSGQTASDTASPTPDPAVTAGIADDASQIGVAAAAVTTALASGDLGAARRAIEEIRDQAAQALRAVKSAAGGGRSGPAARPGQLRELVATHLAAHPDEDFSPHQIGKVLERSSGAVANALDKLVSLGQAILASDKPRRYRHTGQTATPSGATPAATGQEPLEGAA